MSRICFVSYEIHPTTWGGCGVLLHHAAAHLLEAGHEVVFLLDVPPRYLAQFRDTDRRELPMAERCRAYGVDELCRDFPYQEEEIAAPFLWKSLRFAHALGELLHREAFDWVEYFEYCGVGYHSFARRLYGELPGPVLGTRLHNSIEWIDRHEATKSLDLDRYLLYSLERAALNLSETVLTPTATYSEAYYRHDYGLDPGKTVVSQSPRRPFPAVDRSGPRDEIVYFGRVFQFKGVDKLVQAALLLLEQRPDTDLRFVFIGMDTKQTPVGDSHIAYLKRQIPAALADHFEFTGQLGHEETAARLARARFAVFPNEFESFCYAMHELYQSGVPVVAADLPGFRDFLRHEENALLFDGTVAGLCAAMERLLDDSALQERLSAPYEIATEPLGTFYDQPRALAPLRDGARSEGAGGAVAPPGLETLIVVLDADGDGDAVQRTLTALQPSVEQGGARIVVLHGAEEDSGVAMAFLGALWRARDLDGRELRFGELRTGDVLWILEAGDCPDPSVFERSLDALGARPTLAFAGAWWQHEGRVVTSTLDLAPELHPFRLGAMRTRALLRTEADELLVDLFDARLGELGEIGYLWRIWDLIGPGCLWPEPLLEVADAAPRAVDPALLAYLVMTQEGEDRRRRLSWWATISRSDVVAHEPLSRKRLKRLALHGLDSWTLFRLAGKRLRSR